MCVLDACPPTGVAEETREPEETHTDVTRTRKRRVRRSIVQHAHKILIVHKNKGNTVSRSGVKISTDLRAANQIKFAFRSNDPSVDFGVTLKGKAQPREACVLV